MASKSIQILVNEFRAVAPDATVTSRVVIPNPEYLRGEGPREWTMIGRAVLCDSRL
jgi:hypothetical protein